MQTVILGAAPQFGRVNLTLTHGLKHRPAAELGEALAVIKGAQSRAADGAQTAQPSSAAGATNGVGAAPDPTARASAPDGAASQRLPVREDDAVSGASVLTGEPVHLYVMGDRFVRCTLTF